MPFRDMVMAPVAVDLAAKVLLRIGRSSVTGLYQMSGDRDVTFAEAAAYFARRLGRPELVRPVSAFERGVDPAAVVANTTLDVSRLQRSFGMAAPEVWQAFDCLFTPTPETLPAP